MMKFKIFRVIVLHHRYGIQGSYGHPIQHVRSYKIIYLLINKDKGEPKISPFLNHKQHVPKLTVRRIRKYLNQPTITYIDNKKNQGTHPNCPREQIGSNRAHKPKRILKIRRPNLQKIGQPGAETT